ncbi:MAG: hypothetical protein K0S14_38 [Thermomicrobiales bacterium]|jgi:hypothetical protein|nr:hypothetical protein [Thermomicrobiales bacterium]
MAQFARPIADLVNQSWTEDDGTTTDLFDQIDESSFDDADYVQSALAPTSDVYAVDLGTLEDPVSSTGHVIRYRYKKSAASGAQVDLTVQLRQGYVNESSLGTLIEEWVHTDISDTITAAAQTLGATEADSITNYADLQLRFVANQV